MDTQDTIEVTVSPLRDDEQLTVTDYDSDRCLIQMENDANGYVSVFKAETEREFQISLDIRQGDSVTVFLVDLFDYLFNSDISSAHLFSQENVTSLKQKKLLSSGTYLLGVKQNTDAKPQYNFESVLDIIPVTKEE
jgi:hypothetical protein